MSTAVAPPHASSIPSAPAPAPATTTTHNPPSPSSHPSSNSHRRIDLQSPADLTYLINNVRAVATERIERAYPSSSKEDAAPRDGSGGDAAPRDRSGGGEDGQAQDGSEPRSEKEQVQRLIDEFIAATFEAARGSIAVNGVEAEKVEWEGEAEEYEPFSPHLASNIATLHATIERLNLELADLRRVGAAAAAKHFTATYLANTAQADAVLGQREEEARRAGKGVRIVGGEGGAVFGFEGREGDVAGAFREGVDGLGRVGGEMEAVRGRAEEVRRVVAYIEGR